MQQKKATEDTLKFSIHTVQVIAECPLLKGDPGVFTSVGSFLQSYY